MKKFWAILLSVVTILALAVTFAACTPAETDEALGNDKERDLTITEASLSDILGSGSLYATTIGQSDLGALNNVLGSRGAGLTVSTEGTTGDYTSKNDLTAAEVANGDTVIIVVGTSGKGLGSAGTDAPQELARANAFAAKANEINIICVHLGGASRRGATSDPIIKAVIPAAKIVMVVDDNTVANGGNYDRMFTTECASHNVPLYVYSSTSKLVDPMKYLLGIETTAA